MSGDRVGLKFTSGNNVYQERMKHGFCTAVRRMGDKNFNLTHRDRLLIVNII